MYRPEMYQSATKETPLINASIPEHHDDETQNNLHDINGKSAFFHCFFNYFFETESIPEIFKHNHIQFPSQQFLGHLEKKELFNKDTIEGQNVFYSDQYYHDQQVQGQRQLNPQTYYFDRQQDMNEINQHEHHFIENQLNREQQQQQQQVYLERRGIMMNGQDVMYQDENGYYYNLPYNHDVNNSNTYLNEAQTHIPNENSGLVTLVGAENTK